MTDQAGFKDRYWLHVVLFLLTLATTVFSGAQMAARILIYDAAAPWFSIGQMGISTPFLLDGLRFGGSLLLFLSVHEFGHYFAARFHRVAVSLPYYIPFPFNGIGTFGAVIRIREQVPSMTKLFDIGAAGPLAGFVIALGVLIVGFITLPDLGYVDGFYGHEARKEYIAQNGSFPDDPSPIPAAEGLTTLTIGMTPLYWMLSQLFSDVPPMWEMYHYPVLFAGWLGLFFTALNLLPVGQLDGGHMLYALVGPKWHRIMARSFVMLLLLSGGIGFIDEMTPWLASMGPGLGQLVWVILSTIFLVFLVRIFSGDYRWIVPGVLGLVVFSAIGSGLLTVVNSFGYSGWLVWCLLIVVLIKVDHPPVVFMEPLTPGRRKLAWLGLFIFALCFSFRPLYLG